MAPVTPVKFSRAFLREQCQILEGAVRAARSAPPEELVAYRPGGPANPRRDTWGWVRWYGQLCRFIAQGPPTAPGLADPEAEVLKAMRREPLTVTPVHDQHPDLPRPLAVWPKAFDALLHLEAREGWIGLLAAARAHFAEDLTPAGRDALLAVSDELSYQERLCAWAVTHPGPGLPWEAARDRAPEVPAWTAALEAWDLLRIQRAHRTVNLLRTNCLSELVKPVAPGQAERSAGWHVFFAQAAEGLRAPARELMRDRSLAEVVAEVAVLADTKARAVEDARAGRDD